MSICICMNHKKITKSNSVPDKNQLDEINDRLSIVEENISKLEDIVTEAFQIKHTEGKDMRALGQTHSLKHM